MGRRRNNEPLPGGETNEQTPPTLKEPEPIEVGILEQRYQDLPCRLTEIEYIERAKALARSHEDIKNEEVIQEAMKRAQKSRLSELEAKRDELSLIVTRGMESRSIEVKVEALYRKGRARHIRLDTGEIIHERNLTPEEQQTSLIS